MTDASGTIVATMQAAPSGMSAAGATLAEFASVAERPASGAFVEAIPIGFARRHGMLGLDGGPGVVFLAIRDPRQLDLSETVARRLGVSVRLVHATDEQVQAAINRAYEQREGEVSEVVAAIDPSERAAVLAELQGATASDDLLDSSGRSPVIKLVNLLLAEAVRAQASDVHVQPYEHHVVARMRIDGVLYDTFELPKAIQEETISRIKVMARMDIAEKRLPQDGRVPVRVGDRAIDLRVSTLPTNFGERVVIRLLDKSRGLLSLDDLQLPEKTDAAFRGMIHGEHGILLVTGPTGSGKTTTLYAALAEADGRSRNILTIEDPIEYHFDGISQTQVNVKKGMTFANGLRSVLRQDPDIIMVGEIRDQETAEISIQAALTGHLVLSTLHTNDASSAVTRLLDLNIEPYLVASSVVGVAAQRLLRRVCPDCRQSHVPDDRDRAALHRLGEVPEALDLGRLSRGVGCEACRNTGYRGRQAIFELLPVNGTVRDLVQQRANASTIKAEAVRLGMTTLHDDAMRLMLAGQTTIDELLRVATRSGL
ncbi:MAG: ATPase, T2SS/T4P/T4SS family [Planctomycetota bacterium]